MVHHNILFLFSTTKLNFRSIEQSLTFSMGMQELESLFYPYRIHRKGELFMNTHSNQIQRSLLAAVVIVALLIGFAGMQSVQAQTPTSQTLQVANWAAPVTLANVTGRPTVIYDGMTYHMWYTVTEGGDLHYTSFTDPANIPAGTATVTGLVAGHQSSPAVVKEGDTFYMVNYTDTAEKSFSLYTSTDGAAWTQGDVIFTGVGLPVDFQKIDAPSLIQDNGDYKLYFQVRAADNTYSLYAAISTTLNGTYTLANGDNPILTPGASGAWDAYRLQHPMVVKDGANYYMWYVGYPNGGTQRLGFAFSTDGITWTKGAGSPILSGRVAEPSVLKAGDTWHLWYLAESAAIKYISASGSFQFSTIQAAVDAASAGDTISIAPGTYAETIINGDRVQKTSGKQLNFVGSVDANGDPTTTIQGSLSINLLGNDNNWRIENIDFVPVTDSPSVALLDLWNVNGVTIANCSFDGGAHYLDNPIIGVSLPSGSSDGNSNITVEESSFGNGIFAAVQGYITRLTFRNSTVEDATSGINLQGGSNLVVEDSSISVIAKSETNSAFGIRFASAVAPGTTNNLTVTGSTFSVNKNGLVANSGTFYSAIIIRTGAGGTLTATGNNFLGDVVNQATTSFDATGNWWGSATGPIAGQVTSNVLYCNWLDAAAPDGAPTGSSLVTNMTTGVTYCTIQSALDAASAADTIQVAHGDYPEHVSITKPVTLLGPNSEINPITGTRTSEAVVTSFSTPYSTSLSGVTISGFKLTGSASPDLAAIYLGTTSNVILRNNLIEDVAVHGIAHFDNTVDNIVIENNKIVNVGLAGSTYTGMYLGKFTNSAIRNNLIDTTTYAGINLINSTNTDIEGNTVLHTYAQGIQVSDASGDIQVFGNTIDDAGNGTQEADKGGIRLYGTAVTNPIQVYENVVTHSFVGVSIRTGENIVGKNIRLYGNSIDATNTTQVYNGGTGTMNASGNWWGSNDATVFTTKMGGQVDYSPWLNVATDTDSAKPGFQGDFSYLNVDDDSPQSGTAHPVQEGIDLAAEGGTVNVLDGTYYGAILVDKPLTVKSQNGAANTILHGGLATPAIYVATIRAGNVTLDGFTITDPLYNSHSADVTGIMIGYYGDNNLTNIHIINNIVTEIGADDRVLDNMDDYPSVGIALNAVVDGLEIANNTIHDIHQTVSSADITWGPSAIGVYGYDVTPLSTNVTVHDNEIYNIAATNTNGANAIANGIRFGWGSGDGSIANNILHDIAGRGIHITVSNNGIVDITANEVHDCSLVGIEIDNPGSGALSSNDIYQNGTGIAIGAEVNAPVIAHFNRIVDNTTGIDKTAAIALNAENNWWGCNAGPNATDCDTFTTADVSTVDADPWLVLTFTADQVKMTPGGLINLTAKLSINSDGVDTSVEGNVPDGIPVDFSATYGDLDLASSNLIGAQATNGLTLPDPITVNTATVSATVDHETADVTFGYMRYIFLPLINR